MRKVCLFDFDVTICDSFAASMAAVRTLSPVFGVRRFADSEIPSLRRLPAAGLLASLEVKPWKVPLLTWCLRRKMRRQMSSLCAFAGMKDVLDSLRARGITIAIITSNSHRNVRHFLRLHGMTVDIIRAGTSLSGKARVLRKLIAQLGASPAEVLYVGDEMRDVEAAKAAGIPCAVVTWGYNSEDALCSSDPHYVVREPRDLLDIL